MSDIPITPNLTDEEEEMIEEMLSLSRLSDWSREFLESISSQGYPLTENQSNKLLEIYELVMFENPNA